MPSKACGMISSVFSQLLKVEVALCLEGVARPELEGLHVPRNLSQHCIYFQLLFTQCSINVAKTFSVKLSSLFTYKLFCGHLALLKLTQGKVGVAN